MRCERCGRVGIHCEHEDPSPVPRGRGSVRAERRRNERAASKNAISVGELIQTLDDAQ